MTTMNAKRLYSILIVTMTASLLLPITVFAHGDVHQHITRLSKKIAHHKNVDFLLQRAQLFRDDENNSAAWIDYQQVLKDHPNQPDALYLGAKTRLEMGQLDQALSLAEQFSGLIEQHPNNAALARAYQLLADIYRAQHKEKKALTYFKQSMHLQAHPHPNRWLELATLQLKQEGYNAAIATLKQALSQSGKNVILSQKIVALARTENDYKTALHAIDQQLETAMSLRKVILLADKADLLLLDNDTTQATRIKQAAQHAFNALPENRKHYASAKKLQQRIF